MSNYSSKRDMNITFHLIDVKNLIRKLYESKSWIKTSSSDTCSEQKANIVSQTNCECIDDEVALVTVMLLYLDEEGGKQECC